MVAYVKGTSRVGVVLPFKQFFCQVVNRQLVARWRRGTKGGEGVTGPKKGEWRKERIKEKMVKERITHGFWLSLSIS